MCATDANETSLQHPVWALGVKRLLDFTLSAVVLFCIWPLLVIIAVLVKFSSPGPVFYQGVRSGLHNSTFRILKFRTMVVNAEQLGGPTTGTDDPRVTRIGALLRKTKCDELPQFINVLVGDMSLVGPRPEVLDYTRLYAGEERLILSMRPGITDYASIEFADLDDRVGSMDPDRYFREYILPHKNALRVRYVKEWSLKSDFLILWATGMRVIRRVFTR